MGGLQNMEMKKKKKLENVGSRHAAICKRRNGLFKKADELAVLCDAEVGLITISDDAVIHEFASSSMQSIIARFKEGIKSIEGSNPESNSENQEANERMPEEEFACMKLNDFVLLEEQLSRGLLCIRERKIQLLMEEVMQVDQQSICFYHQQPWNRESIISPINH